ncbi:N-acetylglucosaminyldiphosphoundecaprenol N-acetyl-beta-D-mannosaminyltransferase [Archangium gephyra]|uniref:N-acetylglucosaminyldiphosphoundecaprenol N-acetyl-beta-D-mannosaminyltransferase n=1 Tax=Archangium gephyra TaxID=48 RepID=A0ABX9KAB7_9BACT|nr:WecB/TagA/CpsF family glycosyltransferase [Archangium gephyra]REG37077.1 N-acetylglucosaminyldiphosphoundecaprenol N-acetyl-beta-D-mannosaminyltransferase [Archangium gephyra]
MNGVVGLETPPGSLALPVPRRVDREPGRAFPRMRIGQVPLDMGRLDEVLACIERLVATGRGGHVLTPDVEQIVRAESHAPLREALATAELSLAGGPALVRAARVLGSSLPEPGPRWLTALAGLARTRAWRVLVVADQPGLAEWTACVLRDRYGLLAVGVAATGVPEDGQGPGVDRLLDRVALTRPDLVLVSMATPKQELFCQYAAAQLQAAVVVGSGRALESLLDRPWAPRRRWPLLASVMAPVRWLRRGLAFLRVLAASRR